MQVQFWGSSKNRKLSILGSLYLFVLEIIFGADLVLRKKPFYDGEKESFMYIYDDFWYNKKPSQFIPS